MAMERKYQSIFPNKTTHSQYKILKGRNQIGDLLSIAGILGVYPNPHGSGINIVEIIHTRNANNLPLVVKDQTIGNVILEGPIER